MEGIYEIEIGANGEVESVKRSQIVDEDGMVKTKKLDAGEISELGVRLQNHSWGVGNQNTAKDGEA